MVTAKHGVPCLFRPQSLIPGSRPLPTMANVQSHKTAKSNFYVWRYTTPVNQGAMFYFWHLTTGHLPLTISWSTTAGLKQQSTRYTSCFNKSIWLPLDVICLYEGLVWLTRPYSSLEAEDKEMLRTVFHPHDCSQHLPVSPGFLFKCHKCTEKFPVASKSKQ